MLYCALICQQKVEVTRNFSVQEFANTKSLLSPRPSTTTMSPKILCFYAIKGGPKSRRRLEQGFVGADKFLKADGKLKPVQKKRVGIAGRTELCDCLGKGEKVGESVSRELSQAAVVAEVMGCLHLSGGLHGLYIL